MKRIIYYICFLAVIFHAWNPGSLMSTQEIPKEFVGIKTEFQKIMEMHTTLSPPPDAEKLINLDITTSRIGAIVYWEDENGDLKGAYREDENGNLKGCQYLSNIEHVSLDINQDSQKDLIIKADIESDCFRYGSDSVLVVFMNDVSQNSNLKFKGIKFICKRSYVGCPNQGIIKKGRTLVLHDHIYRTSLTDRDFFHRPQRISIRSLTKDSFYDIIFFDENE